MKHLGLNLHPMYGYFIVIILSLILSSISIYNETIEPFHKEKKVSAYLFVIRFIHFVGLLFANMYLFIFNSSLDIIYLIYCIILYLHWPFMKFECIMSYIEYKYYDDNYIPDTAKVTSIYLRQIFGKYTDTLVIILGFISVCSISIVLYRQEYILIFIKIISILLLFSYILYIYYRKKNKNALNKI